MKTFRLYFIRHGQTEGNVLGQYIGRTDLSVTANGITELQNLRDEEIYPAVGLLFASPLKRCIETCKIIYPNKEPIVIPELAEYDFGEFEGKTAFELEKTEDYIKWTSGKNSAPPGGENGSDFLKRICYGLNKIVRQITAAEETDAAVVVHGGVIMSLFAATALPRRHMVEWTCENGKGYVARITPSLYGKSGVIEVVDTIPSSMDYLPENNITFSEDEN